MLMLSGHVELLFLIASRTCDLVSCMYVVLSLLMLLSTTLFVLLVVCLMVLMNCLLNMFTICLCMYGGDFNVISRFKPFSVESHGLLVRVVSLSVICV